MLRQVLELWNEVVLFPEEQHSIGRVEKRWLPHSIGLFVRCFLELNELKKKFQIYDMKSLIQTEKIKAFFYQTWFREEPSGKGEFCIFVRDCVRDNVISKGIAEDIADHLSALWDEFQTYFSRIFAEND